MQTQRSNGFVCELGPFAFARAEVEPLLALASQLGELAGAGGPGAIGAYVRNAKLALHRKASRLVLPASTAHQLEGEATR